MKNKTLKVIMFSLAFAATAVTVSAPVYSAFAAETTTETGAYEKFDGDEIPEEALEKFNLAFSKADYDAELKPIALLETQVVSGTNYKFLAEQIPNNPEDPISVVTVTVYADLNGNAEISTIEVSDAKLLVPENTRMNIEENADFDMNATFEKDDFDFENKTLHVKLYEEALYDAADVHNLAVGDYVAMPDGTFIQVTSLEESVDEDNNNVVIVNKGTLNLTAYEGGTYHCPTDDDLVEMTQVGEANLPFADDMTFTDCTTEPGSSVPVAVADLQTYLDTLDKDGMMSSHYSYWNTHVTVRGGSITEITRTWMP